MAELDTLIINKLEKVETDVRDIKVSIAENTSDLKHHIKRTDDLQVIVENLHTIVTPLHEDYVSKKAIKDYKQSVRSDLLAKLQIPGYILAAVTLAATLLAWLVK